MPGDAIKGAVLMSGIYDMKSTRLARSARNLVITDEIEEAMSPRRHVARLRAPVVITCGGSEAPEFRRQSHDLFAAATAAGKNAELIDAAYFGHLEMAESLGGPYGPNGRAALRLMGLWPPR
jgi:arylformamidase